MSITSSSGYTCLITACYKNHPSLVASLLKVGCTLDIESHGTSTATTITTTPTISTTTIIITTNFNTTTAITTTTTITPQRPDVSPNWTSEEGDSLVMTCCVRGYTEVTIALLARCWCC